MATSLSSTRIMAVFFGMVMTTQGCIFMKFGIGILWKNFRNLFRVSIPRYLL